MNVGSRLAYGCAPIMGRYGKKESQYILETGFDLGVRHFDVARSYGYGEAESLLGNFIKGKQENLTIATKFGVLPSRKAKLLSFAKPFVRPFIRHKIPTSDEVLFNNPNIIDEHLLSDSLKQSLYALNVDKIEMLLIHEPNSNWIMPDNLVDALSHLIETGVISDWGISGYFNSMDSLLKLNPNFSNKIQTSSNILICQEVEKLQNLYAVFSPFHRGYIINLLNSLLSSEDYSLKLCEIVNFDVAQKGAPYLALYLMAPFTGQKIILSTISPLKLEGNIQVVFDAKAFSKVKAKTAIALIQQFKEEQYA